jgi:hypothetical protein
MSSITAGTIDDGVWWSQSGQTPRLIVDDDDFAISAITFDDFVEDQLAFVRSRVVFESTLDNGERGLFIVRMRGTQFPEVVAMSGQLAPGTGGETFEDFRTFATFNASRVAFSATTVPSGLVGFWYYDNGALMLVARHGDPAPLGAGATYDFLYPESTLGVTRNTVVFGVGIDNVATPEEALFDWDPATGVATPVILAPGTPAFLGGTFRAVDTERLSVDPPVAIGQFMYQGEPYEFALTDTQL